jgi:hypothetical protein
VKCGRTDCVLSPFLESSRRRMSVSPYVTSGPMPPSPLPLTNATVISPEHHSTRGASHQHRAGKWAQ